MRYTKEAGSAQMMVVGRRLRDWRARWGGRGSRIPEELWSAATEVALVEGVDATAGALRLDVERLKARCDARAAPSGRPAFVALEVGRDGDIVADDAVVAGGAATRTATGSAATGSGIGVGKVADDATVGARRMVIELTGRLGDRMRVELEGPRTLDFAGLAQTFWRCAS